MQIDLEKTFLVEAPAAASWHILSDIEAVASCMPGAEITERIDEQHYKGKVKARVGPATMAFDGTLELLAVDPGKQELRLTSKGQDSKGTSSAQMDLTAWILDGESGDSQLRGEATVHVTGKIASLGGRLMNQVADQILDQFGKNFAARAVASQAGSGTETAVSGTQEPQPINGLAFVWSVLVGFIKSLFGKKHVNAG